MIPVLYGKDEQQFRTYGLGELSEFLETPEVERERNGNYAFYMKYESDGEFADVLEEGMKIKSDAGPRTEWQTFEINRINRDSQGFIEIFANHISMRTKKDAIRPRVSGRGMNGQQLLQLWRNNLVGGEHWDVWSDITTTVSVDWSIEDFDNAREVLGGREGSILDRIGGEYEFDNQTIRLWRSMGRTAPTALEYGRNIKSVVKENQEDNIYTSIYPFATYSLEGSDSVEIFSIPEYFIDSDYIDMYDHRKVQVVDFTTEFDNENPPTPSALRTLAQNYIEANEIGSPWENITVEYQDLSKTLDYADYQIMEEVELNDVVPIEYPKFNIFNNNAKVIVTVYDPVKEEYKRIELGVIRQRLTSALNSGTNGRLSRLERELEQQHVYIMNSRGNRIWYSTPPEDREHNIGDTWFEQNGQYTRLRVWDGNQWIVQIDTEDIDVVSQQVTEALEESRDAKAQVERESEERRADIQAESERLSAEWNERMGENEQIVEGVRHSTEELMNDFDRALSQANFTSIEDLTTTLNSRSLEAIEIAERADGHALEALDVANGFGTRITDVESTVEGQVTSINTAIATAEHVEQELTRVEDVAEGARVVANRVEETAEGFERTISEVSGDVDDLSSRFVSMEADIEGITNTVSDYEGRISRTEQRADGLYDVVHDPNTGLLTEVSQIAEGWQVTAQRLDDMNEDMVTQAQLSVLEGQISGKVSEGDVYSQLLIDARNVLFDANDRIILSAPNVTFTGSAFIPNAAIEEVTADKITGTQGAFSDLFSKLFEAEQVTADHIDVNTQFVDELIGVSGFFEKLVSEQAFIDQLSASNLEIDGGRVHGTLNGNSLNFVNIDVNSLSGNLSEFVRTQWNNSVGGNVYIDGSGIHATSSTTDLQIRNGGITAIGQGNDNTTYFGINGIRLENGAFLERLSSVSNGMRWSAPGFIHLSSWGEDTISLYSDSVRVFRELSMSSRINMNGVYAINDVPRITFPSSEGSHNGNQLYRRPTDPGVFVIGGDRIIEFRTGGHEKMTIRNTQIWMERTLSMRNNEIVNVSDERLKTNFIDNEIDSLSQLRKWRFAGFDWINKPESGRQFGIIAQSALEISSEDEEGYLNVSMSKQLHLTSHAVQQLIKREENTNAVASHAYLLAEQHEDELAEAKRKIKELEEKVERLEGVA